MPGRFAETFVPLNVRALIIAESGANDGLALPYLMLPLYLVRRSDPSNEWSSLGAAVGHWHVLKKRDASRRGFAD